MAYIYGKNPIFEAIQSNKPIQKIYVLHRNQSGRIRQIYRLAKEKRIAIVNADAHKMKKMVGDVNHQGIIALVSPVRIGRLDDLIGTISKLKERSGNTGKNCHSRPISLAIADKIQDPHNMGAIIRSAEVFGLKGVIYSGRENVPITEVVVKASAGAALHCPLYRADNLAQAVDRLKEIGFWIYGASLEGDASLWQVDFDRHCAIIIGSEEKGIRPLLQKKCDQLYKIPQIGKTQSLNASVAAGVSFAEIVRQQSIKS